MFQRELKHRRERTQSEDYSSHVGLRWCEAAKGVDSWQAGAHDWFVLPFTFASAIARSLLQMKAAGFQGFDPAGFQKLVAWMTDYGQHGSRYYLCY